LGVFVPQPVGAANTGFAAAAMLPARARDVRVVFAIVLNPAIGRIAQGRTTIVAASVKNAVTTG
jgi:hypothetical protein